MKQIQEADKMMHQVLCISPYPGLKYAIDQIAHEFQMIQFDSFIGDLEEGVKVAKEALSIQDYELIISRGGTADLLKAKLKLPIVDIGVSQYDILKTLQAASKLDKVAVIGFESITRGTQTVINDFQMKVPIFTIKSDADVPEVLQKMKQQHFDVIIGDTVTNRVGKSLGLNTLLIASSDESIRRSLSITMQLLNTQESLQRSDKLLTAVLKENNQTLIVQDQTGDPILSYNNDHIENFRQKIDQVKSLNHFNHLEYKEKGSKYQLSHLQETVTAPYHGYILTKIKYPGEFFQNKQEKENKVNQHEFFYDFFDASDHKEILQTITTLLKNQKPIFIIGEEGTGKSFLVHYIYSKLNVSESCSYVYDLRNIDSDDFDHMFQDVGSPLFSSGALIVFKGIDQINLERQRRLLQFNDESAMSKRNQVVLTYETDRQVILSDEALQLISESFSILSLPTFRDLLGGAITRLITLTLNRFSSLYEKHVLGVTDLVLNKIIQYEWPRNYRQFIRVIYTSYAAADKPYIGNRSFQFGIQQEKEQFRLFMQGKVHKQENVDLKNYIAIPYQEDLNQSIKKIIQKNLAKNQGNRKKTANDLSISRTTIWRYLNHP
ncbi:sigma-54-dependent Fis family transcriptional regulator [Sporolactobacillus sp. THM7-4]|nr:sigma-54-dependent Fis family transcriptional regulator [Sporolactobacillus sp. THM7-4]